MNWLAVWLILGGIWSLYALHQHYYVTKKVMKIWWQLINIFLNTLIFPVGIVFGVFVSLVCEKTENDNSYITDFNFTVIKIMTKYIEEKK